MRIGFKKKQANIPNVSEESVARKMLKLLMLIISSIIMSLNLF